MEKSQAYQVLNLNKNFSAMEIKKKYRKLSLQWHPQKNNNSRESQEKHRAIQTAYESLIAELSINYKVNFGFSEVELEEFGKEEIKDLTNLSSEELEKLAQIDRGEIREFGVEEFNTYLAKNREFKKLKE